MAATAAQLRAQADAALQAAQAAAAAADAAERAEAAAAQDTWRLEVCEAIGLIAARLRVAANQLQDPSRAFMAVDTGAYTDDALSLPELLEAAGGLASALLDAAGKQGTRDAGKPLPAPGTGARRFHP